MAWTYTTLTQAIKDYTENTETTFSNNIALFVVSAEETILRTVQLPSFRKNVTGTLTANSAYLSTPTDFLYPYSLAINDSGYEYLKAQAEAFKQRMYYVIVQACQDAILSNQTTLHNMLTKQGHEDMADIIRRL